MNQSTLSRTVAAASITIGAAVLAGHVATAQAGVDPNDASNRFTWGEFNQNLSSGQAKGNVEGQFGCDCSGDVVRQWTGSDGRDRKQLVYPDTAENSAYVTYVREVVAGSVTWRTTQRSWGTDGEAYVVAW